MEKEAPIPRNNLNSPPLPHIIRYLLILLQIHDIDFHRTNSCASHFVFPYPVYKGQNMQNKAWLFYTKAHRATTSMHTCHKLANKPLHSMHGLNWATYKYCSADDCWCMIGRVTRNTRSWSWGHARIIYFLVQIVRIGDPFQCFPTMPTGCDSCVRDIPVAESSTTSLRKQVFGAAFPASLQLLSFEPRVSTRLISFFWRSTYLWAV